MPVADFLIEKNSPILITGSGGFIGKNLVANLQADGYQNLFLYDVSSTEEELQEYAANAKFVFHLAGVNRPKDPADFYTGNSGLTETLLSLLSLRTDAPPVLLTSSAQAGNGTDYAKSKEEAESALFAYAKNTKASVFAYRLPGVFGKWSRPNYNTVVATFCSNIANGLPVEIRDPNYSFPVCYIDDVVASFCSALLGQQKVSLENEYLGITPFYTVTLGDLAAKIQSFKDSRTSLQVADMGDAFTKKLYATYLSYLPVDNFSYPLATHVDDRGSFTEFLRSPDRGQVSINVAKPGIVKGNHWHNTKNEKFLVVSGQGVIRFRKYGEEIVYEYNVSGEELTVLDIPTGYTHNIENTGSTDLVTVMWANEGFDPENPDTYFEKV